MSIISIKPARGKVPGSKPGELYAAITLKAPAVAGAKRPPIAIGAALDISGSMNETTSVRMPDGSARQFTTRYATKLDLAKRALKTLVENLVDGDYFSLTTFEDQVKVVVETVKVTPSERDRIVSRIDGITYAGCTALAGGLYRAIDQLKAKRIPKDATKRVMLFTDGHANVGDQTTEAIKTRLNDMPNLPGISTFGFGDSYNGDMLASLASGGGAHYYIRDPENLGTAFGTELGSLTSLYATDVELLLRPADGIEVAEVLNPSIKVSLDIGLPFHALTCDNLYSEQTYNVVVKLKTPKRRAAKTPTDILTVTGTLTDIATGGKLSFSERLAVTFSTLKDADTKDDPEVASAVAVQLSARAQQEAMKLADRGDFRGARERLRSTAIETRSLGREDLGLVAEESVSGYADANTYRSFGGKLSSTLGSTFSKQTAAMGGTKVGGVDVDNLFANSTQKKMANAFAITKTGGSSDYMPDVNTMVTGS